MFYSSRLLRTSANTLRRVLFRLFDLALLICLAMILFGSVCAVIFAERFALRFSLFDLMMLLTMGRLQRRGIYLLPRPVHCMHDFLFCPLFCQLPRHIVYYTAYLVCLTLMKCYRVLVWKENPALCIIFITFVVTVVWFLLAIVLATIYTVYKSGLRVSMPT